MFCIPNLGFEAKDIFDCPLHASGTMALLCAGADSDIIKLVGCWISNNMLRYLHVRVEPLMKKLFKLMLTY